MANLTESATWETSIYQLETTDPVMGGANGISNQQPKQLANRTKYLKQVVDDHATRVTALESASSIVNRLKGSGSLVKQGVVTSALTNNVFDFVSVAKITTSPILNRVSIGASSTSPLVLAFSKGYDANGPINYYGVVTSNQQVDSGANTSGLLFAEYNETTGAVTFGLDTDTTSVVVSYNTPSSTGYWYSLKDEKLYKWNGTTWVVQVRVIIASVSWNGSGSRTYFLPIGKGIKDVYGRGHVPAGTVNAFAGASAPDGYLLCNGGTISRSIYSDLFASIGTTYGAGDGSTTFALPDLRGEFLRGLDSGRGVDLNSITRSGSITNGSTSVTGLASTADLAVGMTVTGTGIPANTTIAAIVSGTAITLSAAATATNGTAALTFAGRMLGSYQEDAFKSHIHIMKKYNRAIGTGAGFFAMDDQGTDGSENTEATGGVETRPRKIARNYTSKF